jgi:hypothetical protein|tara:strand:+ start:693 stop:1442 length:750 start_codon:yes stop_codon:yes gene_type:complete
MLKSQQNIKIGVITIHNGTVVELERTLNSIDEQSNKPDLNLVIIKKVNNFDFKSYKKKYRKFIIGKDKSLWNAMNIGIQNTEKFNIIFLNSGDKFFSIKSIKHIRNQLKKNYNCSLVFKTILKYRNTLFYPKKKYFEKDNYSPHPSFVRNSSNELKIEFFDEKNKINADGIWMKKLRKKKFKKINKIISVYYLGGQSSNPSLVSILQLLKFDINGGIKEFLKFLLYQLLPKEMYYKFLYSLKFETKFEK